MTGSAAVCFLIRMHIIASRIGFTLACMFFALGCGSEVAHEPPVETGSAVHELGYWETQSAKCGTTAFTGRVSKTVWATSSAGLQRAIDAATPGTEIILTANTTYRGNYVLRNKNTTSTSYITIRSSAPLNPGVRVTPGDRATLARVYASNNLPVFSTEPGAHHYRLVNLEIASPGYYTGGLVTIGSGVETSTAQSPHHFILDRLYIKGDSLLGGKRGVALNGRYVWVQNSWISNFKSLTQDSQALMGWNGQGNFTIANNYLEASGENVLFGGADPTIPDLVPTTIRVKFNHFSKPLTWRVGDPSYAGQPWIVKNLFELKNARDVVIEGNLFEHNWPHAQKGFAILFTVRNQDGKAPWSQVAQVTFRRNVVRRVGAAINILGHDDTYPSQETKDILIQDNLFDEVGGAWGGGISTSGRLFQLFSGTSEAGPTNVVIDHNTGRNVGGHHLLGVAAGVKRGLVYTNQVVNNESGVFGEGMNTATALATNFPDAVFTANALIRGPAEAYAAYPGNFFPASETEVGFLSSGDYALATTSVFAAAGTDGRDLGASTYYLDLASQCH
jgi:hypothetical protein